MQREVKKWAALALVGGALMCQPPAWSADTGQTGEQARQEQRKSLRPIAAQVVEGQASALQAFLKEDAEAATHKGAGDALVKALGDEFFLRLQALGYQLDKEDENLISERLTTALNSAYASFTTTRKAHAARQSEMEEGTDGVVALAARLYLDVIKSKLSGTTLAPAESDKLEEQIKGYLKGRSDPERAHVGLLAELKALNPSMTALAALPVSDLQLAAERAEEVRVRREGVTAWQGALAAANELGKREMTEALADEGVKLVNATSFPGHGGNADGRYAVMLGTAYSAADNGGWSSGTEVSLFASGRFLDGVAPLGYTLFEQIDGSTEFTFTEMAALADPNATTTASDNPFEKGRGLVKIHAMFEGVMAKSRYSKVSLLAGLGASSRPGNLDESPVADLSWSNMLPKWFWGVGFQTDFSTSQDSTVLGSFRLMSTTGDRFWIWSDSKGYYDYSDRIILDGRLELPGVFSGRSTRLALRGYADMPSKSEGPADVRFSLLLAVDLDKFID